LWVDLVRFEGLEAARAVRGFRDHALKGQWQGYRAIRLSDAYRAIYIVRGQGVVETVYVEEVNKHDY
jgi:toxin HigB-1